MINLFSGASTGDQLKIRQNGIAQKLAKATATG